MHILFLTDNFPPEGNAPANRTYEHAKEWVKLGHKVTVITTAPNFPEGIVYPGYKNTWYHKDILDGIEVRRVKTYIAANTGFTKRILDYMSFMLSGGIASFWVSKSDVVIATSPQFFTAVAGWFVAKVRRKPFVFELRDIWPASITAVGAMKKSPVIKALEKLEMFLYRQADAIISLTHSFKKELECRGVNGEKIIVVENGVELAKYNPAISNQAMIKKLGFEDKFVVAYIGTHGMAHALDSIVETAQQLKGEENIVFLFAGGGAALPQVQELVRQKSLHNVVILGRQEKSAIPELLSVCDVSLVNLKNTPLFASVIPSKIFESMSMGIPMIAALPEGEATAIIEDNDAGMVVEPENPEALAKAIVSLRDQPQLRERYTLGGRTNAHRYERKKLALKMINAVEVLDKKHNKGSAN